MKHRTALAGLFAVAALATAGCTSTSGSGSSSAPTNTASTASGTSGSAAASGAIGEPGQPGKTSDPVEWTSAYCEGVGPAVTGALELLKTLVAGGTTNPAVQKDALLKYIDTAAPPMGAAGAKLAELGPPSRELAQTHDEIVKYLEDAGAATGGARAQLAALDPADPGFAAELERIGGSEADPTRIKEQLAKVQADPALTEAFKRAPRCTELAEALKGLGG